MQATLSPGGDARLERSCGKLNGLRAPRGRVRIGRGAKGIERLEAHFDGAAFSPHRHDSYAIGVTLAGVQTFRYRGAPRYGLPGQLHILHPDELHDGAAANDSGFGYRIAYIDPSLILEALGGRPLPFVADPIVASVPDADAVSLLCDLDDEIDDVAAIDGTVALADMLATLAGYRNKATRLPLDRLSRIRELIIANPSLQHSTAEYEKLSGLDRWTLARQFRAAFGTSPGRFRTMRRLDCARRAINRGETLAASANESGFADQSHMTRQFKRAYGLTPAAWASLTRQY